jgi:hypothetical protein
MTVAGKTAQPLQPAAPFARWSAVLAAGHVRVDSTGNLVAIDDPHGATAWWGVTEVAS